MFQRYLLAPLAALLLLAVAPRSVQAQSGSVGIGTTAPDASAALEVSSTTKGLLPPRLTLAQRTALTNSTTAPPVAGLVIYQTDNTPGLYAYDGAAWVRLGADNLGNHTATQNLNLNGQKLTGGGTPGLRVRPGGGVRIDTLAGTGKGRLVSVAPDGTLQASAPIQGQALASTAPAPVSLGTVATPFANPQAVGVNGAGTRAYVSGTTSGGGRLQAYDVSGSGAPVAVGSPAATSSYAQSIAVNAAGTRAYVPSYNNSTLEAFDLSGGGTPVALGSPAPTASTPRDIALNAAGTRAYVVSEAGQLQAFDVSGSGTPVLLGSATTGHDALGVALNGAGTRAYVTTGDNTLEIYDVSGSLPTRLGSLNIDPGYINNIYTTGALAVNPAGTRAYMGFDGSSTGVLAFDVSGNTPAQLGSPVATSTPYDIAVNAAGTRAYVVSTGNAIETLDLSAGGVPVLLGSPVPTGGRPVSLALNAAGTRAYVANSGGNTLQVFNIGGAAPTVVGIGSDGSLGTLTLSQLADNLGNHTATQNLNLAGYQLVSGGSTGLALTSAGNVGIGTSSAPTQKLEVAGNVKISGTGNGLTFPDGTFQSSASSLSNLTGDVTSSGLTTTYSNVVPAAKGGAGTVSGLLKANGSGLVSAATPGTDYAAATGSGAYIQNQAAAAQAASFNVANTGTVGGLLTAGSATVGGLLTAGSATVTGNAAVGGNATVAGRVGIGTTAAQPATQALDVRGNVRLGTDGGNAGTGQAIEWVGPGVTSDPVGIYRLNPANDQSELRVVVGDVPDANDKFVVGRMGGTSTEGGIPTGTFTPTFSVSSTGQVNAPALAGTGTRPLTTDASGTLGAGSFPQLSISNSTISLTNGGSVTVPSSADNLGNHTATQALNLGTNALVGNGGSTGLSISSGGSAQLPAANAYTYATAKAYSITYGIGDMQLEELPNTRTISNLGDGDLLYASGTLRLPVHLPQGATVTGFTAYARDQDSNGSVSVALRSVVPISTGMNTVTDHGSGSSTTSSFNAFTVATSGLVIDNSRMYYFQITATAASRAIGGIRINYTVTQAE